MKLKTIVQSSIALLGLASFGFSKSTGRVHLSLENPQNLHLQPAGGEENVLSVYSDQNEIDFSSLDSISTFTVAGPNTPLNIFGACS